MYLVGRVIIIRTIVCWGRKWGPSKKHVAIRILRGVATLCDPVSLTCFKENAVSSYCGAAVQKVARINYLHTKDDVAAGYVRMVYHRAAVSAATRYPALREDRTGASSQGEFLKHVGILQDSEYR